ncbi:MAG: sulfatase-like hydrolase/transferase [Pirellulaceae bacterium]|nr:sulfatase-like hydrolase/transferase [Pirellulaceae bacterium]
MIKKSYRVACERPLFRWSSRVALLLTVISCASSVGAAPERPNMLVILVDDLGYGDLSSYGAKDLQSPQIDRLMKRGLRFDNFYANCPVCSPTRASLLTGCYPELVGVPGVIRTRAANSWGYMSPNAILLPELLKSVGYDTAIIGKWHLGLEAPNRPRDRGFDLFHGYLGDMMDDYYTHRRHGINYMRCNEEEIDPSGHATDLFTQWSCDYLRSREGEDRPFCLYLAYNAPHTPIQPPADWLQRVKSREAGIDPKRAKLVALIEHMDQSIGKVLGCLEECGLSNDTLIVFTSDNGGQLNVGAQNGNHRDGKQSMYEGGLKVPTCVVWPGQIQAGTRTDNIGLTMDLLPTLCEIAGVELKHSIDGISLVPTLMGKPQVTGNRDLFFHRREGGDRYGGLTIQALRQGKWKLLQNSPFSPLELYDLETDPLEASDRAVDESAVFRKMSAVLRAHIQRGGAVPWQKFEPSSFSEPVQNPAGE